MCSRCASSVLWNLTTTDVPKDVSASLGFEDPLSVDLTALRIQIEDGCVELFRELFVLFGLCFVGLPEAEGSFHIGCHLLALH